MSSSLNIVTAFSSSEGNATIGNITFRLPWTAERSSARAWMRRISGRASKKRIPRKPRNDVPSRWLEVGNRLVTTYIEHTNGYRFLSGPLQYLAVDAVLPFFVSDVGN